MLKGLLHVLKGGTAQSNKEVNIIQWRKMSCGSFYPPGEGEGSQKS